MCLRVNTGKRKWARFLVCVRVCVRCTNQTPTQRSSEPKQPRTEYETTQQCIWMSRIGFAVAVVFVSLWAVFLVQHMQRPCIELDERAAIQQTEQHTYKLYGSRSLNSSAAMKWKKKTTSIHPTKGIHLIVCVFILSWVIRVRVCAGVSLCVKSSQRSTSGCTSN